jgi:GH25 family lysozyme M1 (1,4-beta-N-acetylmuramidase)
MIKKILILSLVILAGVVIVSLSADFYSLYKEKKANRTGIEDASTDNIGTEGDPEDLPDKEEQGAPTVTIVANENTGTKEEENTITPTKKIAPTNTPTVEVAAVDDAEDPQAEGTKGIEVDVTDMYSPDNETDMVTFGVDIAKWQGIIDWEQVKSSGIEFAMIRVGYRTQVTGEIFEDPYAKYNLQQAQSNGIKIGVYFFSTAISKNEAEEEAEWVADYIAPYPITYPVVYNCEGFSDTNNRQYGMSADARTDLAIAFLNSVKSKGYTPMFYAAKNELEQEAEWNTETISSKFKIWVAQYPDSFRSESSESTYSGKHAMWQYTSNGIVPGIDKPVDMNIAYFGYEKEAEVKDDTPQETATADPTALINFSEVDETVTAKIEANLRTVPSAASADTIKAVLKNGDTAKRTGLGNNGWSRLEYDGQMLYAVSSYLTTELNPKQNTKPENDDPEAGITFTEVEEQVTAKEVTNLRLVPNSDSKDTIVIALHNGEVAIRTGIGSNGWSRVEYNDQVLYAVSSYLKVVMTE